MNTSLSFLQSPEWEAFQRALERKTWCVEDALVIRHDLPLGFNYLYCPRPGLVNSQQGAGNRFFEEMQKIAQQEKSIFLKIDPLTTNHQPPTANLYYSPSLQPRQTIIIDLSQSEEQLLFAMHPKTRYNIRLAEKKEVSITNQGSNKDAFDVFWTLMQKTAKRDGFGIHQRGYYEKMLAVRSDEFSNELFFAEYRGMVCSAALVNFYIPSTAATYLHGASSDEHREVMGPHRLHWRIMQEAKRRGFRYYDFWGIDEKKWPGLTRFKKGFGGVMKEYPQSVDAVYRMALYRLYRAARLAHRYG